MSKIVLLIALILTYHAYAFFVQHSLSLKRSANVASISMEYIPDGVSKEKWAEIKRKEAEEMKNKNLGAIGITKFKSRSFEAWQKSGAQHLYPVDSSVPINARPYMQRTGGRADGEDLKKKGLKPVDQGKVFSKTKIDEKYDELEKEGKTRAYPFTLPWTSDAAQNLNKENLSKQQTKNSNAGKSTVKSVSTKEPTVAIEKKKGFFGLF